MIRPNLFLFYVNDPLKSAAFYEMIFERKPVATFPTYVGFEFDNGMFISLWSVTADNFVSGGTGHRSELAFMIKGENNVRKLYNKWKKLGVQIEQELTEAVFGLTFVALDPDGHRIRVCMPDN